MVKCKHKTIRFVGPTGMPLSSFDLEATAAQCVRCMAIGVRSLWPANDGPAEVQVEMRAAELTGPSTIGVLALLSAATPLEIDGWNTHSTGEVPDEWMDSIVAGWLARQIYPQDMQHDERDVETAEDRLARASDEFDALLDSGADLAERGEKFSQVRERELSSVPVVGVTLPDLNCDEDPT